jgi:hypothetical protein
VSNFGYWHLSGLLSSGSAAFKGAANQHHLKNEVNSPTYGRMHHCARETAPALATGVQEPVPAFLRAKENFIFDYENGSCIVRQ